MKTQKTPLQTIAAAAKVPEYAPAAIKALMKKLDANDKALALLLNVTPMTVRLWTSGAVRPCGTARRLMQLLDTCPDLAAQIVCTAEKNQ